MDFNGDNRHKLRVDHTIEVAPGDIKREYQRVNWNFAYECSGGEPSKQDEVYCTLDTPQAIRQLGLENCQNTVLGDAMLRGVSGGERKRVTTGEMAFGNQPVLMMDEISTGLDSAATFDIVSTQYNLAKSLGKTVVISLLQPSPEVFELFDDVLLLNDGYVLYHGPRSEVLSYFEDLGFKCPPSRDEVLNAPPSVAEGTTVKKYLEAVFEVKHSDIWYNFAIVVVWAVGLRLLALTALRFINYQSGRSYKRNSCYTSTTTPRIVHFNYLSKAWLLKFRNCSKSIYRVIVGEECLHFFQHSLAAPAFSVV
ncbi:P-loop containing nucleoside triphosphate hydrolase [Phytophthora cactorum]|nr:P-loop containing nucleoside triphosphate hydrolase [Phytophthora cactorum]